MASTDTLMTRVCVESNECSRFTSSRGLIDFVGRRSMSIFRDDPAVSGEWRQQYSGQRGKTTGECFVGLGWPRRSRKSTQLEPGRQGVRNCHSGHVCVCGVRPPPVGAVTFLLFDNVQDLRDVCIHSWDPSDNGAVPCEPNCGHPRVIALLGRHR